MHPADFPQPFAFRANQDIQMRKIPPRTVERQACELDCSIEATEVTSERRAVLCNLSESGARLEGPELDGCPEIFELRIVHKSGAIEKIHVRCVWRKPGAIGVHFEEPSSASRRRGPTYSRAY
jgi:hypothetical protein